MPKKTASKDLAPADFEKSIAELEKLVAQMESGEQSLENSLKLFQRGIELTRSCQANLQAAEQRVEKLIRENGEERLKPLEDD